MNILQLILVLISIETGGQPNPNHAIGDNGKAHGCLQIHPIMVRECNRILDRKEFTLKDRNNRARSIAMAVVFLRHQIRRYRIRHGRDPSMQLLGESWNSGNIFRPCLPHYRLSIMNRLETSR